MNSDSLFIRSWTYVWKNNRKELLRGILGLLRDRPIFLFLTVACLIQPSWWGFLVVPLALVLNQLLIEIFSKRVGLHTQNKILTGFLNIYENPDVVDRCATKYKVSDYLDWQYDDINKNLLRRFIGLLGIAAYSIDEIVDLYHITIVGANCPNLICYNIPPLKSYIFLNSAPNEKKQAFKKFCLLHELGHASLHFATSSAFSQHGNKLYLTLIVFLAILCSYDTLTGIFYLTIGILLLMSLIEKFIINIHQKLNDECIADMLAIGYLDPIERKVLRQFFIKYPPKDANLSNAENAVRQRALLDNLELMISNEDNEDIALNNLYSRIFKPSFSLLIITCALVSFLAFYCVKIGGCFTLGMFIACIILFIVFIFCHLMVDVFSAKITDKLSNWNQRG